MATDLPRAQWQKSSYSGGEAGQCVEVADTRKSHASMAVRDSKVPNGPALLIGPEAYTAFIGGVAG
ncbi:DUF397 domain-containing protein (plasmid) [Streptomyces sp. NBC_00470]